MLAQDVVHADVDEFRGAVEEVHVHSGLLDDLPPSGLPRRLAGIEMSARLQPRADDEVPEQNDAAVADDETGSRDVHRVGVAVEWIGEP